MILTSVAELVYKKPSRDNNNSISVKEKEHTK